MSSSKQIPAREPERPPDARPERPAVARRTRQRALLVGAGAFVLFGGWALFANRAHPGSSMVRAGLAQGGLSFVSTTSGVLLLEYLYRLGRTPARKLILGAVGAPAIIFLAMTAGHLLAGTPNVVTTLLPSWISGTMFCVSYTLNLRRLDRRAQGHDERKSGA